MKASLLKYGGILLAFITAAFYTIGRIRQGKKAERYEGMADALLQRDIRGNLAKANEAAEKAEAAHERAIIRKAQTLKALDKLGENDETVADLIDGWHKSDGLHRDDSV